jgi:OHCU decarboxylase
LTGAAAETRPIGLDELNRLDRDGFVAAVGFAYEKTPWVAGVVWRLGPFASFSQLQSAMREAVEQAPIERQLELIRAHPELADRAVELTRSSSSEQAAAGLDRLSAQLRDRLLAANAAYRERFGWPFVICVSGRSGEEIVAAAERRLGNDPDAERSRALEEIFKIAALRLRGAASEPQEPKE